MIALQPELSNIRERFIFPKWLWHQDDSGNQ